MNGHRHDQTLTLQFHYPVYFTNDVFAHGNSDLAAAIVRGEPGRIHRMAVILDQGVADAAPTVSSRLERYVASHADRLESAGPPLVVPGGEAAKNDPLVLKIVQDHLADLGLDRQAVVMIVGGGAVLDMAGYAAAVTHRGVRVVRVPTTVLSQDDAGVSVKNGINAYGRKNYFGTFAPPFAVINDVQWLATLSRRDRIAGMSEAIKAALIRDAEFYDWIALHADNLRKGEPEHLAVLIRRSAMLHLNHIAGCGDPFEQGSARPLDFGHWAAHKLESMSRYELRHGEAVAIGVALDTLYSYRAGFLARASAYAVLMLLRRLGLPSWHTVLTGDGLFDGLREFREHVGGELTITLLAEVGRGFESNRIDRGLMLAALDDLRAFSRAAQPVDARPVTTGAEP